VLLLLLLLLLHARAGGVVPDLTQLFSVGQYVRCVIKHLPGSSGSSSGGGGGGGDGGDGGGGSSAAAGSSGSGGGGSTAARRHIVASLRLKRVMAGLAGAASEVVAAAAGSSGGSSGGGSGLLQVGQVLPAVVQSLEDRGFTLGFGIKVRRCTCCKHMSAVHTWAVRMRLHMRRLHGTMHTMHTHTHAHARARAWAMHAHNACRACLASCPRLTTRPTMAAVAAAAAAHCCRARCWTWSSPRRPLCGQTAWWCR
jgi:hypothetical protein